MKGWTKAVGFFLLGAPLALIVLELFTISEVLRAPLMFAAGIIWTLATLSIARDRGWIN